MVSDQAATVILIFPHEKSILLPIVLKGLDDGTPEIVPENKKHLGFHKYNSRIVADFFCLDGLHGYVLILYLS